MKPYSMMSPLITTRPLKHLNQKVAATKFVEHEVKKVHQVNYVNPFSMKVIPPFAQPFMWESQLESITRIAAGEFCVVTNVGNFSITNIKHLIKLHKAKTVGEGVCKEIDCLTRVC